MRNRRRPRMITPQKTLSDIMKMGAAQTMLVSRSDAPNVFLTTIAARFPSMAPMTSVQIRW